MDSKTFGQHLKTQRLAKDLSQRNLALLTGLTQSTITRLERDTRTPTIAEWKILRQHLSLPSRTSPDQTHLPKPCTFWRIPAPRLSTTGSVPFQARKARARESFKELWNRQMTLLSRRSDQGLILRFLNEARLDSAAEAMYWALGFAGGGRPRWCAPTKVGFRKWPVVRGAQSWKAVGDIAHACLEIVRDGYALLMFPQVRVVTHYATYVLDALVCVRRRGRRKWVNVEIDGGGHGGEFDRRRQSHLGLATIRLRPADLAQPDMLEKLERRLLDLLETKRCA